MYWYMSANFQSITPPPKEIKTAWNKPCSNHHYHHHYGWDDDRQSSTADVHIHIDDDGDEDEKSLGLFSKMVPPVEFVKF